MPIGGSSNTSHGCVRATNTAEHSGLVYFCSRFRTWSCIMKWDCVSVSCVNLRLIQLMSGTAGASRGSSPAGSGVSAGADAARAVIATCTAATSSRAGAELARYPLALASLISASRRFISSNESPRLFVDDTPVSWSISRSRSSLKSFFFFFRGCGVFGVIEGRTKACQHYRMVENRA